MKFPSSFSFAQMQKMGISSDFEWCIFLSNIEQIAACYYIYIYIS